MNKLSKSVEMTAIVFYAGLLMGLLGIAVVISSVVQNAYSFTLIGGILASIGFVAVACALISAESQSDKNILE